MNTFTFIRRLCPQLFRLMFGVALALNLSSCGVSEKGAEKLCESGSRDLQANDPQTAQEAFSKAIDLDSKYAPAYEGRAQVRFALKDFTGAEADCGAAIKLDPHNEQLFLMRGYAEYQLNDLTAASNDFNSSLSLYPKNDSVYLYRGALKLKVRDWDGAVVDFTNAIELNPDNAMAFQALAGAEVMLKEYEKAIKDASSAIDLNSTTAWPAYGLRSHAKSRLKDRAGALADAELLIQSKPAEATGYIERAEIEMLWDDFQSASNDLANASQLDPTNSETIAGRAVLEHKTGQLDAAEADYNRVHILYPEGYITPDIDEGLGQIKESKSQWNQALVVYREGLAFNNPPEELHFYVFVIECRLGQTQAAQKELKAYLKTIPPAKARDWPACTAHFLAGDTGEPEFLAEATTTAKRTTDIPEQICDAYYYAGMVRLLAGDKTGAGERFQKSVDTKEDNNFEYMDSLNELKALKNP